MACRHIYCAPVLGICILLMFSAASRCGYQDFDDIEPLSSEMNPQMEATTGRDGQLIVRAHAKCINGLAFSPDGAQIATCSQDGTIRIWDAVSGKYVYGFRTKGSVLAIAFTPDGGRLIAGTIDHGIHVIDTTDWKPTIVAKSADQPQAIAITQNGNTIAVGSSPIDLFEGATYASIGQLEGHEQGGDSLAFSHDGQFLASGNADQRAIVWDMAQRKPRYVRHRDYWVTSVDISPDGRLIAVASFQSDENSQTVEIELVNSATGRLNRKLMGDRLNGHIHSDISVLFSPDNGLLISLLRGSHDTGKVQDDIVLTEPEESISIWNVETNQLMAKKPSKGPYRVAIAPSSTRFAVANVFGTLEVWNIDSFISENPVGGK